jgi:ribosomal protein L16 Arg81 hydroxylase
MAEVGRPTIYSEELATRICEMLAEGQSERAICRRDDMPSRESLRLWRKENKEFLAKCAHARIEQGHTVFDEMADIEQQVLSGEIEPAAANVVLSSKRWRAEKLNKAQYGTSKVEVDHSGSLTVVVRKFGD